MKTLRQYQREGVEWIKAHHQSAYVADEMGLGKTAQAVVAVHEMNAYPALVLCPTIVACKWAQEIKEWYTDESVCVLTNGRQRPERTDWCIVPYSLAQKCVQPSKWGAIICDEAHMLKNPKAARTKHVDRLAKYAGVRILMSGTPVMNRPQELVSQFSILGILHEYGGAWRFIQRYCDPILTRFGWDVSGCNRRTVGELAHRFLRRTYKEVLPELPPHEREYFPVILNDRQRAEYRELMAYPIDIEKLSRGFELIGLHKAQLIRDYLEDLMEQTEDDLLVFGRHKHTIVTLRNYFEGRAVCISSSDSPEERARKVEEFQSGPKRMMIAPLLAAGVGITVTKANRVIMVEQDWVPANMLQAEARVRRIGQARPTRTTYVVAHNTIDHMLCDLLVDKLDTIGTLQEDLREELLSMLSAREAFDLRNGERVALR